jgi:conjugative relaxase-like TrwC/TraI family protein|tara:strand:- start:395247 stop:396344 length:1098 start_codon:yes stop_codon:yes gene_type:complete
MVASISARKSVSAAVSYFKHMTHDEYYTGKGEAEAEADGEWDGRGAERLALEGPVSKADFEAALNGIDPKTGERLTQIGKSHAPGWDMTFSAPKSVSVMWALSPPADRKTIEAAHRQAVHAATTHLEDHHAFTRRGKGGAIREPVAGLTIARFHHHTSRDLDPQLHTHAFIFNTAPRRDGTWGSLVSRDLYKAQKEAGAVYREHLANRLERDGHAVERYGTGFRLKAIPRDIERAFSKRRQAIEQAADTYGYRTPKGMELAALRTRQAKRPRERAALFQAWQAEARTLGFDVVRARQLQAQVGGPTRHVPTRNHEARTRSPARILPTAQQLISAIAVASRASSNIQGVQINLHQKAAERDQDRER